VAKRSPILGYNHNVRYRGLVFHVQTEDSGVLSPHLFTHLFYEGVIVSTRKLVYDAGASEDAIKALMQAQHKAVLKDLKVHTFDDKIDEYLGGTPGLEPREGPSPAKKPARASEPAVPAQPAEQPAADPVPELELAPLELEAPVEVSPPRAKRSSAPPPARTQTAERTSRGSQFRSIPPPAPPPPELDDAGTLSDAQIAAQMQAAATVPTQMPTRSTPPPIPQRPTPTRAATPPPIPHAARKIPVTTDSSPEIEIIQHDSARNRSSRDTDVDNPFDDGIPAAIAADTTLPSDGVPKPRGDSIPPVTAARTPTPGRPASHVGATLPPVKPASRPAITPASVVSRPLPPEQRNRGGDSDAVEVYAPAPPSVEPPPGERTERPGQYSMNRRQRDDVPMRETTGRIAIPAGLGRPRQQPQSGSNPVVRPGSASSPPAENLRGVPQPAARAQSADGVPRTKTPSQEAPPIDRHGTQPRASNMTSPMASRTGTGTGASGSGNVVMTRPAVIVGAPPKPLSPATTQRVRKAREDEGRGFGQGLISEKSLDEVILAYLSEDAEEK
jgi:hypothetical protein